MDAGNPVTGDVSGLLAGADVALRRLAESGLIAVATATREQVTWANGAFLRLVGYSEADLAGTRLDWRALTPPEWVIADRAALAELEETGSCGPFRKEYWHKDQHRVPVEISAVVLSGDPFECVCFIRDASSEQQAERAAQRAAELAALAVTLAQAATVTEVAQALLPPLRRSVGAGLATLIEADPARGVLRFADLDAVPEEVTRQWREFDISLDSPAARAWHVREPVFFGGPDVLDREFPHLAGARAAADTGSCLAVPLIAGGAVTGVLAVTWPGARQLSGDEESFLATVAGYAAQAVERARLAEAERAARTAAEAARAQAMAAARQLRALQEVTAGLSTAVTTDQIAQVLTGGGLGLVATHGVVAVLDPAGGYLHTWGTASLPAEITQAYARIPLSDADGIPVGRVARTGETIILASLAEITARFPQTAWTHEATGTRSLLIIPVRAGLRVIGALAYGFCREGLPDGVVPVAEALAGLAGQALERARLYEAEHAAAHQLQRSLLPQLPAALAGVSTGAAYRPAEQGHEVGGDWYDVFALPDGRIGCVTGDVVGHDLQAAAAMGRLQPLLRYVASSGPGPARVLEELDAACPAITGTEFATVAYAEYDPARQALTYACAGHPPPVLADGTAVTFLESGRSGMLGLGGQRSQARIQVPGGARLVLYTDGLIERRGQPMDAALAQLAAAASQPAADIQDWCDHLLETMTSGTPLTDDVAILCIGLGTG